MNIQETDTTNDGREALEKQLMPSDIHVLDQIHERKLHHMFQYQRDRMPTVADNIKGAVDVQEPYADNKSSHVDIGATHQGILRHRGIVMRNLDALTPLAYWDLQAAIAMFCSGVDRNHSFAVYFKETRSRLRWALNKRMTTQLQDSDEDALMTAYTLACMEYARFQGLDPSRPTRYMRCFAELYMKNPRSFILIGRRRDARYCSIIAQRVQRLKASSEWDSVGEHIKANLEFIYPKGDEQIATDVNKPINSKRQRKSKNQTGVPAPPPASTNGTGGVGSGFANKLPPLTYGDVRIRHHLENNPLLSALVEPMPGLRTYADDDFEDDYENMGTWRQALKLDAGYQQLHNDGDEEPQFLTPGIHEDARSFCKNLDISVMAGQLQAIVQQTSHVDMTEGYGYKPMY